ncbi:MAG: hypothetical protein RL685_1569 [Pseudomonadota bacterium]|jgi:hypothetical protein
MAYREVAEGEISTASFDGRRAVAAGADYLHVRRLESGRAVYLEPHSYGGCRLTIGTPGALWLDDQWHFQGEQWLEAWRGVLAWDGEGEPEGWYRHPATGRRRPGGDASKEFIQW